MPHYLPRKASELELPKCQEPVDPSEPIARTTGRRTLNARQPYLWYPRTSSGLIRCPTAPAALDAMPLGRKLCGSVAAYSTLALSPLAIGPPKAAPPQCRDAHSWGAQALLTPRPLPSPEYLAVAAARGSPPLFLPIRQGGSLSHRSAERAAHIVRFDSSRLFFAGLGIRSVEISSEHVDSVIGAGYFQALIKLITRKLNSLR